MLFISNAVYKAKMLAEQFLIAVLWLVFKILGFIRRAIDY